MQFTEDTMRMATKDFSSELKLGEGGFGEVYKGYLNGTFVAIKRLSIVRFYNLICEQKSLPFFRLGPGQQLELARCTQRLKIRMRYGNS